MDTDLAQAMHDIRAGRGARVMDELYPGWYSRLLAAEVMNVQVSDPEYLLLDLLTPLGDMGFGDPADNDYEALQRAWERQIDCRTLAALIPGVPAVEGDRTPLGEVLV